MGKNADNDTRKRTDTGRQIAIDFLSTLPADNPNPIICIDRTGILLYSNDASEPFLKSWNVSIGQHVPDELKVPAQNASASIQICQIKADERNLEFSIIAGPNGKCVYAYGKDITQLKNYHQRIKSLAKFPEENPNPVLRLGLRGELRYTNDSGHKLVEAWSLEYNKDAHPKIRQAITTAIEKGQSQHLELLSEGQVFVAEIAPVSGENYLNVYARNITEQRKAESTIKEAHRRALQAQEAAEKSKLVLKSRNTELEALLRSHDDHSYAVQRMKETLTSVNGNLEPLENYLSHQIEPSNKQAQAHLATLRIEREKLRKLSRERSSDLLMTQKTVLLVEQNSRLRSLAKLALRGIGLQLKTAKTVDDAMHILESTDKNFDVLCVGDNMLEVSMRAFERKAVSSHVYLTPKSIEDTLPILKKFNHISSVVARCEDNRNRTLKNILVTVRKLATGDLFGIEKYLTWGAEISERKIYSSTQRSGVISEMANDLSLSGVRRSVVDKTSLIAEELLMNAIYDAPCDSEMRPLYNHIDRKNKITLPESEAAILRWGLDGSLLGISVEDCFGSLTKQTVLKYLDGCFGGFAGKLNENDKGKAGAGMGLFQCMAMSDLLMINSLAGKRLEMLCLLDLERKESSGNGSLHFFFEQ